MPIRSTVEDYRASIVADRVIAWDATQTPRIREAARLRSLRSDAAMADEGMRCVLADADEDAKQALREAGRELALVAGTI